MDRIQTQASKLWDLLFDEETANTYQSALSLTGNILKESGQLIWLILCSFFVFGAWFADASTKTGQGVRDWVENRDAIAPSPESVKEIAAPKGKSLLDTGRESVAAALSKAREELGLDPNAPLAAPRKDSPVAKLVTPSTTTKTASTDSSAPSSSASSTTASSTTASTTTSSPTTQSTPSAGAVETRPATSEGQNIGSNYAASTGSGSPSGGFGSSSSSSSQSGSPQSSKYDASQDFDDDIEEEDFGDDAGSSWPPQPED